MMCEIWGRTLDQVLNVPLFKALPEVAGQGFEEILAEALISGKPFVGNELPATLERKGKIELTYFNILYKPLRDNQDCIIGIIQVATEVTEPVILHSCRTNSPMSKQQVTAIPSPNRLMKE